MIKLFKKIRHWLYNYVFGGKYKYYNQRITGLEYDKAVLKSSVEQLRKDKDFIVLKSQNYFWAKDRGFKARFKGRIL